MINEVRELCEAGFSLILLHERSKRPVRKAWTSLPFATFDQLKQEYKKGQNIAVRLGEPSIVGSGYLHAIDVDIRTPKARKAAMAALDDAFPDIDLSKFVQVASGSGNGSHHIYFTSFEPLESAKIAHSKSKVTDTEGHERWEWEIELFGSGKSITVPPSRHATTGRRYKWIGKVDEISEMPRNILSKYVAVNERNVTDNHESLGISFQEAKDVLDNLADFADDRDTWVRVGMALKHEFSDSVENQRKAWKLFDAWSKQGKGYNKVENKAQWDSFKNDRREIMTFRSLLKESRERELYQGFDEIAYAEYLEEIAEPPALSHEEVASLLNDLDGGQQSEPPALSHEDVIRSLYSIADEHMGVPAYEREAYERVEASGVPANLLHIPGKLQHFVQWFNKTCMFIQPQFAVSAALTLGSVILARHWKTNWENYTSHFCINVGQTGCGKEHIRKSILKILNEVGLEHLIGPRKYASEAGVFAVLESSPRHVTITDEFGAYLGTTRNGDNTHARNAETQIMETFGLCDGIMKPTAYSNRGLQGDKKPKSIHHPGLSFSGMTAPERLYSALTHEDIHSGYLNRFIVVISELDRVANKRKKERHKVPRELRKWIKEYAYPTQQEDDVECLSDAVSFEEAETAPNAVEIPFSQDCNEYVEWIQEEAIRRARADKITGELYVRTAEIAMRLSLIVALSCESETVEKSHLKWAWEYVLFYNTRMIENSQDTIQDKDLNVIGTNVLRILDTHTDENKGMRLSRISDYYTSFRNLSLRDRDEVINKLERDELIARYRPENKNRQKGGRPSVIKYYITAYGQTFLKR